MAEEYPEKIELYDHVPNSGILHMPDRRFPAVAIQGDSLSIMLSDAVDVMHKAKEHSDEDLYYLAQNLASRLKGHLVRYEQILEQEGFDLVSRLADAKHPAHMAWLASRLLERNSAGPPKPTLA